jgi:hypothetical protein
MRFYAKSQSLLMGRKILFFFFLILFHFLFCYLPIAERVLCLISGFLEKPTPPVLELYSLLKLLNLTHALIGVPACVCLRHAGPGGLSTALIPPRWAGKEWKVSLSFLSLPIENS